MTIISEQSNIEGVIVPPLSLEDEIRNIDDEFTQVILSLIELENQHRDDYDNLPF